MFDWDDQELANIIWGETSEGDDHIVPYPEEIEKKDLPNFRGSNGKKLNEEDTNDKASEQNTSTSKPFSSGGKQDNNDAHSASGVVVDPQLDLPCFSTSEIDDNAAVKQDQLDIGPEILQNQHEDKELGELVGNSWANIGSFDDLDRIFSNDDLDGHASLGSADDLWPSSKDLISGTAKSSSQALDSSSWEFGALGSTSTDFDITPKYLQNESHSLTSGCQKSVVNSSYSPRNVGGCVEQEEFALGTTNLVKEKVNWSNTQSKHVQRPEKIIDSRALRNSYDRWPSSATNVPQFDSQCTSATIQNYPASVPTHKRLPQDSSTMMYKHFSDQYVTPYAYGNFRHHHPAMHMPKQPVDEHVSVLSNSEACARDVISMNKPLETSSKTVNMTPQEKIEKLRRRQQMRAMLAIRKQQQQLGHNAPNIEYALPQKSCAEDQIMHFEKTDDEKLSSVPCYDPSSPKDDSCAISDIEDFSAEDTVLYQLQDVIARLDLKIRLCVRDSLYRLAQSATQRSYTNDTSSTNRAGTYGPDVAKEDMTRDKNDRCSEKANIETETNHIDRVVAHLLFHRPFKVPLKPVETPESSTSNKVSNEQEIAAPNRLAVDFLNKSSGNEYNFSPRGSKTSDAFIDSYDKDTLNDTSQRELRINSQKNQKMTVEAD